MDIYSFLNLINDISNVRVIIYDLNTGKNLYDKMNCDCEGGLVSDIEEEGYDSYEIKSIDVYHNTKQVIFELNIEIEED